MEPIVTEIPRETRVLDAVVSLVDSLLDDFDVVDLLTELTEQCAQLLDVAAAGLLLATPRRQLQLMAATSEKIHDLELFQLQADQGPCLDCYATGQPIPVADMQTEAARWPRFAAAATEATGWNASEVWRSDRIRAAGATPTNPSVGADRPAMIDAVSVPWLSQSDIPSPALSTKSPPGSAGTRGEPFTPVSMTATVTPAPVANFWASLIRR
jgi:hypothetical protein